ncbi:MAG: tetratricopeptide repeat protein [Chitinophaga sp.]|uniref:tetratricopeptide repeat-containing sensor histidine kinase n=1 Tax=Chitinophaga sp. TaxID=1869181 RepID=UPI001B1A3C3C|nr:tetratricopeptide repeat protein [Chitinophaga sp.]MBO9729459.1 tetratricopeptide repeat protein [Chitinophaga sp.]
MWRILVLICCIVLCSRQPLSAAYTPQLDSLSRVIHEQAADSNRVQSLYAYGCMLLPYSMKEAEAAFRQGLQLSRQLSYHKGVADFACYYMYIQDMRGEYAMSLYMVKQAVLIYAALKDTVNQAIAISYCGQEYQQMANFQAAASAYLEAMKLAETARDSVTAGMMLNNLAAVFNTLGDYRKGFIYASQAYQQGIQLKRKLRISAALLNMGQSKLLEGNYDAASDYFNQALLMGRRNGDSLLVLNALTNQARVLSELSQHTLALQTYKKALLIAQDDPGPENLMLLYMGYAQALHKTGDYTLSDQYLQKTIQLAKTYHSGDELRRAYLTASDNMAAQHRYEAAFRMRKAYEALNDSLVGRNTRSNVQQLETQYLTEKKDRDLAEKKLLLAKKDLELQRKNIWIGVFLCGVLLLLAGCIFIWQRLQHRHHLQQQRLQRMEIEKTMQVLEAMMQGEEKERTRLSKDLHDGVGGMLSAVKMHFWALKYERSYLQQDKGFNHALNMLDDAIGEVRKTAHNLMPEILARMGLAGALEFFCNNVSHSRELQISCYTFGTMQRFKGNFELSIYRLVQELINNIIKHAKATEALVQITQHEELLTITVEDNGIGFENVARMNNGMGLKNLESRTAALNGHLTLTATPGCGTTVYMEFNIAIMQLMELQPTF